MREAAAVAAACGKNIAVYQDYKGPEQVRAIYFSGTYANLPHDGGPLFFRNRILRLATAAR